MMMPARLSIADRSGQDVPSGTAWTELRWLDVDGTDYGTQFALEGAHLIVVWLSPPDLLPASPRSGLRKTLIDAVKGSATWETAVEEALKWLLLPPPLLSVRITRHLAGGKIDFTERQPQAMPDTSDPAWVYIGELFCEPDKPISIDVRHNATAALKLDKNLHMPRVVSEVIAR